MRSVLVSSLHAHAPNPRSLLTATNFSTASAAASPSTAALTIPPAYPAPSPAGNNPAAVVDMPSVFDRVTRTGEVVLASGA